MDSTRGDPERETCSQTPCADLVGVCLTKPGSQMQMLTGLVKSGDNKIIGEPVMASGPFSMGLAPSLEAHANNLVGPENLGTNSAALLEPANSKGQGQFQPISGDNSEENNIF